MALFTPHSRALTLMYADLEGHALTQREVFVGTAGSVIERKNAAGFRFYAHQFYDADGAKRERYLAGPVGSQAADTAAEETRVRIRELKALVPQLRLLGREGYNLALPKTYGTVASLHNQGVFTAGALLIGSHAYGVLLNRLGARAVAYATEDIDIARGEALATEKLSDQAFVEMLRGSGVGFVDVPALDPRAPSTSWKERGRSHFHVDLLAPSPNETFPVVPVPELKAHALGLPYLGYLLAESQMAMLIAREGCCPVRVPLAERFAVHKLVTSRLRVGGGAKSEKDVFQAAVLCAVLAETQSGAVEAAVAALPRGAGKHFKGGRESARRHLERAHPRAWEELGGRAR
jgi:hypothetical protein